MHKYPEMYCNMPPAPPFPVLHICWSFRSEVAMSQPIQEKCLLDFYAGVWLFAANKAFYPGEVVSSQEPMGAFQFHVSYNFNPLLWVAFNTTYYLGGASSFNG